VRIAAEGLAFPNGMLITPDGQTLIVAESYASRLTAFDIEPDGSLARRRVWAQFEEGVPDGICLDAEGAVWVASPEPSEVFRVREGGQITHRISIDAIALACTLGGPDHRTLFITSTESLDFTDSSTSGRIEAIQVDVPMAAYGG
jgi:sugar lactone lactonase YvrE